jgi:hypothetical protein
MRAALALAFTLALAGCSSSAPAPQLPSNTPTGAPPPVATGPIGTAGPITIEASDPAGRWVVACQARTDTDGDGEIAVHLGMHGDTYGDRMSPYLVIGGGAGDPIDAYVGAASTGDWLVVATTTGLFLVDGRTGARTELVDADLRSDDFPTLGPRLATFAGTDRVVFLRHRDTGDRVVVRDLASGRETETAVPGLVWRVEADPGGAWARVLTVRTDTNKNGTIEWPSQQTSLSERGCRGPIGSYSTFGMDGDKVDTLWVALDHDEIVDDPTVRAVAGKALVRITTAGALVVGDVTMLPAGCDPAVRATAPDPVRVLAGCGASKGATMKLQLVDAGGARDLGIDAEVSWRIDALAPGERLACVDLDFCVDITTGTVLRVRPAHRHGDRVLVERDTGYAVLGVGGAETALGPIEGYPKAAEGPIIAIGHHLIDLASATVLGAVTGEIAAVDRTGRALVTEKVAADTPGPDLPGGPANWKVPE